MACQSAFEQAKEALKEAVLLHHPHPDAPTSLTVDTSNTAVGAQLEQKQGQYWVPLGSFSRKQKRNTALLIVSSLQTTVL